MMDIVWKNKKGFSMLEMLVCMCIITSLLLVTLRNTKSVNFEHYYFLNDYLYSLSQSLLDRTEQNIGKGISINSMGHVNQARTVNFDNHDVVIHLGNGYATIK